MPDAHANFAVSTVATAPSPATSGTSLVVASGEGTRFPAVPFNAVIKPNDGTPADPTNAESVRVTNISTDTFTITRTAETGQNAARSVQVGDLIYAAVTKKTLTDIEAVTVTELTYDTLTSTVNVTSQTEASGDTVVTASAITVDGSTPVWIEFFAPIVQAPNSAGIATSLCLFEGATQLGRLATVVGGTGDAMPVLARHKLTPSNGSHTYKITAFVGSGTGHVYAGSGGTGAQLPGYIRITK